MIMVAGDRVTTDVVAVPFSKARNLLCIYSKRHIDNPPEEKSKKMRHNAKTMTVAHRRLSVPSRRRRDSSPGEQVVGGLFFDFGAVRTESRDHDAPRMTWSRRWRRHESQRRPCSASSRAAASASGSLPLVGATDRTLTACIHRLLLILNRWRCSG